MAQPDTWYVSFTPDRTDGSATGVRSTRRFKSEVDAKLFAMQIVSKGWIASAGTINPHQPKQVVGPSQIERWADSQLDGKSLDREALRDKAPRDKALGDKAQPG
jgi:hypothetical protein